MRVDLEISPTGGRSLSKLDSKAFEAAIAFIQGRLLENPLRISKPCHPPFERERVARVGEYRVFFTTQQIEAFEPILLVTITGVRHRRDAYRT